MKKSKGKDDLIAFRIPSAFKERLEDLADEEGLSVSQFARQILYKALVYRENQAKRPRQIKDEPDYDK